MHGGELVTLDFFFWCALCSIFLSLERKSFVASLQLNDVNVRL